jgi:hypothetical protein
MLFGGIYILDGLEILTGNPLEYLWIIFLIFLGTWIIINSLWKPNRGMIENSSIGLRGANRGTIRISHGAGHLNINSGAGEGDLITYSSRGSINKKIIETNGLLDVRLSPDSDILPMVGFSETLNWDLKLSEKIPLYLILETGASQTTADLSKLNIPDLKLSTGASSTSITLPSMPERADVSINAGVASLNLKIPTNIGARIRVKDGLTSLNIDKDRFIRVDENTYQSLDFNQQSQRTEIKIEAGVGSITIH